MSTLGRISGPMLKDNLKRHGVDLAFETDLLYLNVTDGKVGVGTDIVPRELTVDGNAVFQDLIVDSGLLQITDTVINGSTGVISNVGYTPITINSATANINFPTLSVNDLYFDNSTIQTTVTNSNLEIRTHGNGRIELGTDDSTFTDVLMRGNLHTLGDVTLDGNITFGDSSAEDQLSVYGKISSDIMPSVTDLYNIGSPTEKWKEIHARTINGEFLTTTNFGVPGITTISARPGNTWYVSAVEGDDTNVGDHQMGPFRTIKHALSQASAGDQVYIYTGDYEEYFPLTVPKGVTVNGEGIRSVKVYPHTSNNDKDAFLLNGEVTVENLTVSNFYYNATNNTGYAFRFANNFQVDTRSPYIRNISVITTSDSSDESAGRGALVDGSVATSSSIEASMLFHSVTFITPGSIALFMTNGVRVEWLNSFTYFASRGLYATNGSVGRLTPDGSTIKKGAELRSIGSANVYGTVGAEADGNECLMYLIQHNFAYIGAGTSVENDPTIVTQQNETIEVNTGKIYYQSVDQDGDFRVGEAFVVDQDTGFITANGLGGGSTGLTNISFSDGVNNTEIDSSQITAGNIQLTNSNINTIGGDLNVDPSSGLTILDSDVDIEKQLTVDGDMIVNGAVTFGGGGAGGGSSSISFDAPVSIDLEPTFDKVHNLGSDVERWSVLFTERLVGENIEVFQNRITTTISSSNLELEAAGTGVIQFLSPVEIQNNLTANTVDLQKLTVTGNIVHTGNTTLVGDKVISGNYTLSGFLNLNDDLVPFDDIKIAGNKITTTESNSNLELIASGTGNVSVTNSSVQIDNDLTLGKTLNSRDVISNSITAQDLYTEGLYISQNNIVGTSNNDVDLRTLGTTDSIEIQDNVELTGDLQADIGATLSLSATTINGIFVVTGPANFTGNSTIQGNLTGLSDIDTSSIRLDDIHIDTNVITTTVSNSNLELRSSGTGKIVTNELVVVENTIDVKGALDFQTLTAVNSVSSQEFFTDQIKIRENYFTTISSNGDLELRASGTGEIYVSENNLQIDNDLTVSTDTVLNDSVITGTLTHTGTRNEIGTYTNNGNLIVTNDVTIDGYLQGDNVRFETNYISSTESNSNLALRANGTGKVVVSNTNVSITKNLTVVNDIFTTNANITNTLQFDRLEQNEIILDNNFITTSTSNTDLELRASGTGSISIDDNLHIENNVTADSSTSSITSLIGSAVINGPFTHIGNNTRTGTTTLNSAVTINNSAQIENVKIDDNVITTVDSNSDLELRAAGTGEILIDGSVDVSKNITILGSTTLTGDFTVSSIVFNSIRNDDILVDDNFITTTLSNSNLDLRANGAGILLLDSNDLNVSNNLDINGITTLTDTIINGTLTHVGNSTHTGNYTNNGPFKTTENFVTDSVVQFSNIKFLNNSIETTESNSNLELRADGNGKVVFQNDTQINFDLFVDGDITSNKLTASGTITADILQTQDDLRLTTNTISTTVSNSNVHLRADTNIQLDKIIINENVIQSNQTNQDIDLKPAGQLDVSTSGPQGYTATLPISDTMYIAAGTDYSLSEDRLLGIVSADLREWANAFNGQSVTITLTGQTSSTVRNLTGTLVYTSGDSYLSITPNTLGAGLTFEYYDVTGLNPNSAVAGTTNFILPKGTTAQAPAVDKSIRFDTTLRKFTGHISGVKPFGGVYSANMLTSVTVSDERFFAGNQTINFQNNNIQTAHIDSNGINVIGLAVDNLTFNGSNIESINNEDINISSNGTGDVIFDNIIVRDSLFENQHASLPLTISNTASGYVKFDSTTALVVPNGGTGQRTPTPETGEIRYNTDLGSPEVYNGTTWATWAGSSVTATEDEIDDISNIMAILLG